MVQGLHRFNTSQHISTSANHIKWETPLEIKIKCLWSPRKKGPPNSHDTCNHQLTCNFQFSASFGIKYIYIYISLYIKVIDVTIFTNFWVSLWVQVPVLPVHRPARRFAGPRPERPASVPATFQLPVRDPSCETNLLGSEFV